MPVKCDTKKKFFCTSSEKLFLKDGKFDNIWFGHLVVKPVDFQSFQRIKYIKERGEEKNDVFDMEVLELFGEIKNELE